MYVPLKYITYYFEIHQALPLSLVPTEPHKNHKVAGFVWGKAVEIIFSIWGPRFHPQDQKKKKIEGEDNLPSCTYSMSERKQEPIEIST